MVMKSSSLLEEGPWYFQWFVMNLWAMFPSLIQYIPFALLSYDQYILIFTIKKSFYCLFKWVFFISVADSGDPFFPLGRNFCIRRDFISNPSSLRKRLMAVGFGMLLISPFLVIFMLVYLFLRHAEQFYNHPSTASSRRWSNLSKWVFREFNEVLFMLINICAFPLFLCATPATYH